MARKKSCNAATTSMLLLRWCPPCIVWVGQASQPPGALLQMLLPVQWITGLGDGYLFSGPRVQSWRALLQSVGLAGAMQMRLPGAGSGSVGSRIHISHTDLAQKTLLRQKSSIFGEVWKRWLWTMWRYSEKSSSVCCQHTSRVIFWQRPSPTNLFT